MRLLASTDFALRVLMRLSAEPPGGHLSVEALARELGGLSRNHLHKVVQDLAALGVVRTVRGARGGVALAGPPRDPARRTGAPAGGRPVAGGVLPRRWRCLLLTPAAG